MKIDDYKVGTAFIILSRNKLAVAEREANVRGFTEQLQKAKADVAKEIFAEIEFDINNLDFDREETRAIAIEGVIANLKKKFTGESNEV